VDAVCLHYSGLRQQYNIESTCVSTRESACNNNNKIRATTASQFSIVVAVAPWNLQGTPCSKLVVEALHERGVELAVDKRVGKFFILVF